MKTFLAFRCYGTFQWPPLTDGEPKSSREGSVEIHYLEEAAGKNKRVWNGHLRWIPVDAKTEEAQVADLYDLSDLELVKLFEPDGKTVTLRFTRKTGKPCGPRLQFDGISVLDQFAPDENMHYPTLRVPLVPTMDWEGKARHSTLQIGNEKWPDGTSSLRLDLVVPLPLPANAQQAKVDKAFFAFSAVYASSLPTLSATSNGGLVVRSLPFGLRGESKNEVFTPKGVDLGRLHWTPSPYNKASNENVIVEPDDFWPDASHVLSSVLSDCGYPVVFEKATDARNKFTASTEFASTPGLKRFPGLSLEGLPGDGVLPPGFRIRQRVAVRLEDGVTSVDTRHDSRLRIRNEQFHLQVPDDGESRHPDELPQWLSFGPSLYVEATLTGNIADTQIQSAEARTRVRLNIGSPQKLPPALPGDGLPEHASNAPAEVRTLPGMLGQTIAAMRLTLASQAQLSPARPLSLLPELTLLTKGPAHFGLFAEESVAKPTEQGVHIAAIFTGWGKPVTWRMQPIFHASLQPADIFHPPKVNELAFKARWPAFDLEGPRGKSIDLRARHADAELARRDRRFFALRLHDERADADASRQGLIADMHVKWERALLLSPAHRGDASLLFMGERTGAPGWSLQGELPSLLPRRGGDFKLQLGMAVDHVQPINHDSAEDARARRLPVLLLDEAASAVKGTAAIDHAAAPWHLQVTESMSGDPLVDPRSWELTAELIDRRGRNPNTGEAARKPTVMFSSTPFSFMRYHALPLDERGDEGNSTVARYDSTTGRWTTLVTSAAYHYVLPPQSVGESMDKPRRLEIHDLDPDRRPLGFERPYPDEEAPDQDGAERRHLVDFRLTPPADLWVRPSDVERNYLLPEWASRQLFSRSSEGGTGAAMVAMRAEFVYGLSIGLWPDAERGPSRRSRVTEIEALTGSVLDRRDSRTTDSWDRIHQAFLRRPERLEVWADDPDSPVPFAPARFEQGARFALRTTALHRPAVLPTAGTDADLAAAHKAPPSQRVPGVSPRQHAQGLAGGALWPVESLNVLNMLLDQPASTGGHVESIALSPSGGDADQTVRFCNDRVAIITETRNGHVQRQRVEVVGRIAVWWHRAKHVVVYERTVNPSAQFTPEGGIKTRTRRPVLRKVREYIELMQPERRYPDADVAAPSTNAFVQGMRFNSTIIPVDSFWGENVDSRGWKVPLWNRHAARQRPQVYAMPDVVFLQASEGTRTDALSSQPCVNPDNLYFFTNTRQGFNADTDNWPHELSIDWINLPPPSSSVPPPSTANAGAGAQDVPEPSVPRGFARFTWRLAPAAQRTAINQARGERPVYASLRTLTFMRAGRVEGTEAKKLPTLARVDTDAISGWWQPGKKLEDGPSELVALSTAMRAVEELQGSPLPPEGSDRDAVKATIGDLRAKVAAFKGPGVAQKLQAQMKTLSDARDFAYNGLVALLPKGDETLENLVGTFQGCDEWKRSIAGSIGAKRLAIDQELQAWETGFIRQVDGWENDLNKFPKNRQALEDMITPAVAHALRPVFEGVSAGIGQADQGIESARSTLRDLRDEIGTALDQATREVHAIREAIDRDKPWSRQRLDDLSAQINDAFQKVVLDARTTVADARDRLTSELDDVSRRVGESAAIALREVDRALVAPREAVSGWFDVLSSFSAAVDQALRGTDGAVLQARKEIEAHKAELAKLHPDLAEKLNGHVTNIEGALASTAVAARDAAPKIERVINRVDDAMVDAAKKMKAGVVEIQNTVNEGIETLKQHGPLPLELDELVAALESACVKTNEKVNTFLKWVETQSELVWIDFAVERVLVPVEEMIEAAQGGVATASDVMEAAADTLSRQLADVAAKLQPESIAQSVVAGLTALMTPLLDDLEGVFPVKVETVTHARDRLVGLATTWRTRAVESLKAPEDVADGLLNGLGDACDYFENAAKRLEENIKDQGQTLLKKALEDIEATDLYKQIKNGVDEIFQGAETYAKFLDSFQSFDRDVCRIGNDLARTGEMATAYVDQAVRAIGNIGSGGLLAAPNNILRAMAAIGSVPALPNLDYARRQMGYYYGLVDQLVDTTQVEAWFGRLGDSLKAWGLSLPFNRIGDRLLPVDLSDFDIGDIFRNCGGLELQRLFKGCRLPKGAEDAVRLSHDFNKETFRAWVQLDIDAALSGRKALVSLGPFCLNAVNTRLVGRVRLEASKDTDRVDDEGEATLNTDFEAAVGGQVMVTLREVAVRFSKGSGLKVDFDPKKVEINRNLQFVQNALGSIFGDEIGGLKVVKQDGIPVGLEHVFSMPPMSLMFGTSGLQNIQISNQFQLIAYPDFRISNRFSLARPELPFIFSIFIIGGTGWLTVDVDYRPFGNELMVVVDAAAGGSASLGFACAGCTGAVAITLAAALTYRKLIGASGGGLTVSMVVTIVGVVDVLRIASAHLSVVLRLSYAENGDIDANGGFRLEVRITRFFKASAAGDARYRMAGGKRETQSSLTGQAGPTDEGNAAVKEARAKAEKLLKGQGKGQQGG